jgi:AbrB family looped-hinge helix DNA binding protein
MKTVVSEKGQITIPKELRDRLGLDAGVILDFDEERGALVGRKRTTADPIARWRGRGRLPARLSVDAYLRKARE